MGDCKRSGETLRQGGDKEENGTRVTWKGFLGQKCWGSSGDKGSDDPRKHGN